MSDLRAHDMGDGFDPNDGLPQPVTDIGSPQFGDVSTPLYDASITGTGTLPNDSTIDDDGPADVQWPEPDYDPQMDSVEAQPAEPDDGDDGGFFDAGDQDRFSPVDLSDDESQHDQLSDQNYSMGRGEDDD